MEAKETKQDSQIKTIISETIERELKIINGVLPIKYEVDPSKLWICEADDDEEEDRNKRRKKRKIPKPPNPNIGVRNLLLHIHKSTSSTCCITADHGAGRSTLAQYLTHAWSSGVEDIARLKEFEAVFFISARNVVGVLNNISDIKRSQEKQEPKDESAFEADSGGDVKQMNEGDFDILKEEKQESQVKKAWNDFLSLLLPMSTAIHGPEIVSECVSDMEALLIIDDAEDLHECRMESLRDIYKYGCELNITIILMTDLGGYKRISQIWESENVVRIELLGLGRSDIVAEAKSYTDKKKSGLSVDLRDLGSNGEIISSTNDSQIDAGNRTNEMLDTPKDESNTPQVESNYKSNNKDDVDVNDHKIARSPNVETKDTADEAKGNESTTPTAANPKTFLNMLSGKTKVKKSERRTYYEVCGRPKNVVEFISRNLCRLEKLLRFPEMLIRTCDMYSDSPDLFDGVSTSTDLLWTLIYWEGHNAHSISHPNEDFRHLSDTDTNSLLSNESGEVKNEKCTSMLSENPTNDSDPSSSDQKPSKRHSKSRLSCDFSEFVHKCSKSSKNSKEPDKNFDENIYNWLLYLGEKCLEVLMSNERMEGDYLEDLKTYTVNIFGDDVGESFFNRIFKLRHFYPLSNIPGEVETFVSEHLHEKMNAKLQDEIPGNESVMSDSASVNLKNNIDNCEDSNLDPKIELSNTSETNMNIELPDKKDSVIAQSPNLTTLKLGVENFGEMSRDQHSEINSATKSDASLGENCTEEKTDSFGGEINEITDHNQDMNHTNGKKSMLHESRDNEIPNGGGDNNDKCECLESNVLEDQEHKGHIMDSLRNGPVTNECDGSNTTNDQGVNSTQETLGVLNSSQYNDMSNTNERTFENIYNNDDENCNMYNKSKEEISLLQRESLAENGASGNEVKTTESISGKMEMESENCVKEENVASDMKDTEDTVEDFWGNILESNNNEQMENGVLGNDMDKSEIDDNTKSKIESFAENKNTISDMKDFNDSANEDFWGNILVGSESSDHECGNQVKNDDLSQKLTYSGDVSHNGDEITGISDPDLTEHKSNENRDQLNFLSNSMENDISNAEDYNKTSQRINEQNTLPVDLNSENLCVKSLDSVSEIVITNGHKLNENIGCEILDCSAKYSEDNRENGVIKSNDVDNDNHWENLNGNINCTSPSAENNNITTNHDTEPTEEQLSTSPQDGRIRLEDLQNNLTEQTSVDCENKSSNISEDQNLCSECDNFTDASILNDGKEDDEMLVVEKEQKQEKVEDLQQERYENEIKHQQQEQKQEVHKQEELQEQQENGSQTVLGNDSAGSVQPCMKTDTKTSENIINDLKNQTPSSSPLEIGNKQDSEDLEYQRRVLDIINDLKTQSPSSSAPVISTRNQLVTEFFASWFLIHEIQSGRSFASLTSGSRHSLRQLCIFGSGLVNRIRKIVGYNRDLNRQRLISALVNYRSDSSYELSFNMDMVAEFKSSPDLLSFIVEASEYPDEWHVSLYDTQIVPLQALLLNVSPSRIFLNVEEFRPFSEEKYMLEFVPRVEILVWLDSGCQFTYGHKDRMDKVVKAFTAPVVLARVELVSGCLTHTGLLDLSPHVAFEKLRYLKLRVLDMESLSRLLVIDRQIKSLLWLEIKFDFDWISEDEASVNNLPRSSVPLFDVYFQGCGDEDVVRISTIMSHMHTRYSGIHLESTSLTPEGVYVLLKQLQQKKICLYSHPTARQKFRRWYYPQFANQPALSDDQARERLGYDDRIFYSNHFVQSSTYASAIDAWNLTSFLEEEEKIVHFVYSTDNIKFVKRLSGQVEMERVSGGT